MSHNDLKPNELQHWISGSNFSPNFQFINRKWRLEWQILSKRNKKCEKWFRQWKRLQLFGAYQKTMDLKRCHWIVYMIRLVRMSFKGHARHLIKTETENWVSIAKELYIWIGCVPKNPHKNPFDASCKYPV